MAAGRGKGRWVLLLTALFSFPLPAQDRIALCASCHGPGGNPATPGMPSIAGQPKLFLETQLVLFREGLRPSEQMQPVMRGVKDAEIVGLAEHFSALPAKPSPAAGPADPERMKAGAALAKRHRCGVCHVSDFSGQKQVPRLAGQDERYLLAEMKAYQANARRGGDTIMAAALYGLKAPELSALAHFLSRSAVRAPAGSATKGPSAAPR